MPSHDDRAKEACGLFGIYGHRDAARLTYLGLYSLQHRGEEAAGIVTYDGKQFAGDPAVIAALMEAA